MTYSAEFRCASGCPGTYALVSRRLDCPTCHGLLEVSHDLGALAQTSPAAWKARFDTRHPWAPTWVSGVWSKKEWVCPTVADECIVSLDEGATTLLPVPRLAEQVGAGSVWLKQCGHSHTGSFKDLGMTVLISVVNQMIRDGQPVRAVVCASSGDTSAALAAYAASAGIPAIVLLPRGLVSTAQLLQPLSHGALVLALDTDFDGCMAIVQRLAEDESLYLANSMNSLRLEGQKTVAFEIAQQLGWQAPDLVIIPGGNLGNVSALGAGFEMLERLGLVQGRPRIVVAQAAAANPLYLAYKNGWRFEPVVAGTTVASAIRIGNPVSVHKAIRTLRAFDGQVEQASESELLDACARADELGLFTCPHTGVALAALRSMAARGDIDPSARVVVISTASGLKFSDAKLAYHEGTLAGITPDRAHQPVSVDGHYDAVRTIVDRALSSGRAPNAAHFEPVL